MNVVLALVAGALVGVALAAVGSSAWSSRAEHERRGLCGVRRARSRVAFETSPTRSQEAAALQLSRLVFTGTRLDTVGPLAAGWWQLSFADGTTLFVVPADRGVGRLRPRRSPTVVQAWRPRDGGVDLVLEAVGSGPRPLPCRDLVVVPAAPR